MSNKVFCDRCKVEIQTATNVAEISHKHWHNKKNWQHLHKGKNYIVLDLCNECSVVFERLIEDFKKETK